MKSLKTIWKSLNPGDVITSKNIDSNYKSIVLEKNKQKIHLSPFCPLPLLVEMPNGPFSWSEKEKKIIDAQQQPMPFLDSIEIERGLMADMSERYKRISKSRKLTPTEFNALANENITTMLEIDKIIKNCSGKCSEVMSLILNRVLGINGYTNTQLVALTQIITTFRDDLDQNKKLLKEEVILNGELIEENKQEALRGFNEANILLSPFAYGNA